MSEQESDFDAKREAYETARAKLANLIDNPEKHLPVSEYRTHLVAAGLAVTSSYAAMMAVRA